jgi:hypothetical protein
MAVGLAAPDRPDATREEIGRQLPHMSEEAEPLFDNCRPLVKMRLALSAPGFSRRVFSAQSFVTSRLAWRITKRI